MSSPSATRKFHGSTGNIRLNQPIVGGIATASGRGYWFVARDGGVFSFGDARFHGSIGGANTGLTIVGMAPAPNSNGYLLLASNGRVFSFGSAKNYGSAVNSCSGAPAVAIATSRHARGYWIAFANAEGLRALAGQERTEVHPGGPAQDRAPPRLISSTA